MIIIIRRLKTEKEVLYSVLETKPLSISYSIKTKKELIDLYNSCNKLVTGLNYTVSQDEVVMRTSVGTSMSISGINDSVKDIFSDIPLSVSNIWTAISAVIYNDFTYNVILSGKEQVIRTVKPTSHGICINDVTLSKEDYLEFIIKDTNSLESISNILDFNKDFASIRGNKIIFNLKFMTFEQEFSSPKMRILVSNIKPVISQLLFEYSKSLTGFVTAYSVFSVKPDMVGEASLSKALSYPGITLNNSIESLNKNNSFSEQEQVLFGRGIKDYILYGNHSSLTYSMQDYFIYKYKVSELVLLQLLLCNCG